MSNATRRRKKPRAKQTRLSQEDKLRNAVAAGARAAAKTAGHKIWLAVDNGKLVNRIPGAVQPFISAVRSSAAAFRAAACRDVRTHICDAGLEEISGGSEFNDVLAKSIAALQEAAEKVRVRKRIAS